MQFWNTAKLIEQLKHDQLSQANYKNYYITVSLLTLLGMYAVQLTPRINTQLVIVEFVLSIGLLISATNSLFAANGADSGKNFLNRIVSLMLPISIKVFVLSLILYVITIGTFQVLTGSLGNPDVVDPRLEWFDTAFTIVIQIVTYWRLYVALKKVNS